MALPLPEYDDHDASGLADLVARGEVTPGELHSAARARIDALNPTLNAVIARRDQPVAGNATGPLAGVPYLLKDLGASLAGVPTSHGLDALAHAPARVTSTVVARLQRAGLAILGKTNTPELGLTFTTEPGAFGPTRNPWDLSRTPGGSSGGAAAAVASGMVPAAHASDGGGSIRVPAACCGLVGLKPTRARVPSGPVRGEGWGGLSVHHAVTRSVRDSAALLDAVAGPEPGDPYAAPPPERAYRDEVAAPPGRLRIGLRTNHPDVDVAAACRDAVRDTARLCDVLGHEVREAAPDTTTWAFGEAFLTTVGAHVAADLASLEREHGVDLDDDRVTALTRALRRRGMATSAAAHAEARAALHAAGRRLAAFFTDHDVLLTPATARPPVPLGHLDMDDPDVERTLAHTAAFAPFPQLANATGCPSISLPLGWSGEGLPLGSLFTASLGREDVLLRLAAQLERARPWWHRRPTVHAAAR